MPWTICLLCIARTHYAARPLQLRYRLRRVCAPTRVATDNIISFDATWAHQWMSCCAGCARRVAISRRNQDLTVSAWFSKCWIAERKRRNRRSQWTSRHVVDGLLLKTVRAESIVGVLYNQAPSISQQCRSYGYVGNVDATVSPQWTSPLILRLWSCYGAGSGRAPALHGVDAILCADVTPFRQAQGKPRRKHAPWLNCSGSAVLGSILFMLYNKSCRSDTIILWPK